MSLHEPNQQEAETSLIMAMSELINAEPHPPSSSHPLYTDEQESKQLLEMSDSYSLFTQDLQQADLTSFVQLNEPGLQDSEQAASYDAHGWSSSSPSSSSSSWCQPAYQPITSSWSYSSPYPQNSYCTLPITTSSFQSSQQRYAPASSSFSFMPTSSNFVRMEPPYGHMLKQNESFKLVEKLRPKKTRTKYSKSQVSLSGPEQPMKFPLQITLISSAFSRFRCSRAFTPRTSTRICRPSIP